MKILFYSVQIRIIVDFYLIPFCVNKLHSLNVTFLNPIQRDSRAICKIQTKNTNKPNFLASINNQERLLAYCTNATTLMYNNCSQK